MKSNAHSIRGWANPNQNIEMSKTTDSEYEAGFLSLLSLTLLSAIIPCLFLVGFSGMGYGLEIVSNSQSFHAMVDVEMILALILVLFLFDSHYWPTPLRIFAWSVLFAMICVILCLMVAFVPYGPICIFSVLVPLSIFGIKNAFFPNVPATVLVGWNYKVYVSIASVILVSFFYWCSIDGNMWDSPTNAEYSQRAGCTVDFTNLEDCENNNAEGVPCFYDEYYDQIGFSDQCTSRCINVYQACEEAFITWSFPGLAAMSLFVMGFISKYLENPSDPHNNHHISAVAKFCAVFLFMFWIFASLAGAGEGLSSSLIAFAISMFIGSGIVFAVVFWNSLLSHKDNNDIMGGVAKQVESYINLVRGLVVLGFSPLILVYLLLSMVNQFFRRFFIRHLCKSRVPTEEYEHKGFFTLSVSLQIEDFLTWDHAKVLSYGVYWGVGYVFLNVLASKLTTVFLSWLIEYTSDMNLLSVTGIVIFVGMILFMLPPIPGLPIYLTGGIVLVSVGKGALGLWGSILYACFISLALKLLACTVQQKIIGGNLGGNVGVKQIVAVNSEGIRAMRVMLSDKGITARKVAVLVGGPDWPVSVLCGILGLDLFPILIGTIPVIALIVPTVFCGSFAYMGSLDNDDGADLYPWAETMGAVSSAVAAGVMFYFTLSAASAVKNTLENDKEIIDSIPLDEEVEKADEEVAKRNAVYSRVTVWNSIPFVMKMILVLALFAMMGCCYLLVVFNSQCFQEYDLMYTIQQNLGGKWTNIVLPLGRVALLLFTISYGLLYIFESWATFKANELLDSLEDSGMTALRDTIVPSYSA